MHVDRVITPELECSCVDKTYEELTNYEAHDTCMYVRECKSLLEYVLGHGSAKIAESWQTACARHANNRCARSLREAPGVVETAMPCIMNLCVLGWRRQTW